MGFFVEDKPESTSQLEKTIDGLELNQANEHELDKDPSNRARELMDRYIQKVERMASITHVVSGEGDEYAEQQIEHMNEVIDAALIDLKTDKLALKERKLHKILDDVELDLLGLSYNRSLEEKSVMLELIEREDVIFYREILDSPKAFILEKNPYAHEIYTQAVERALREGQFQLLEQNEVFNRDFPGFDGYVHQAIEMGLREGDSMSLAYYFKGIPSRFVNESVRRAYLDRFSKESPHELLDVRLNNGASEWPEVGDYYEQAILSRNSLGALNMDWSGAERYLTAEQIRDLQRIHFQRLLTSSPHQFFDDVDFSKKGIFTLPDYWEFAEKAAYKEPSLFLNYENSFKDRPEAASIFPKLGRYLLRHSFRLMHMHILRGIRMNSYAYQSVLRKVYGPGFVEDYTQIGAQYHPDLLLQDSVELYSLMSPAEHTRLVYKIRKRAKDFKEKRQEVMDYMLETFPLVVDDLTEKELKAKKEEFYGDPAFSYIPLINDSWLDEPDEKKRMELKVFVARNLYAQDKLPDFQTVKEEMLKIHALKENPKYRDMNLFKGRDVLFPAHMEKYKNGKYRFGRPYTERAFRAIQDGDGSVNLLRPRENNLDAIQKEKISFLLSVEHAENPLTVVMQGHGSEYAWYFSDGEIDDSGRPAETESTITIDYEELAKSFMARAAKGHDLSQDVLIVNACSSYNLVVNVYQEMKRLGAKSFPVFISSAEYKLYGFTFHQSKTGSPMLDYILSETDGTLGDLFDMGNIEYHNPSIFIPDEETGDLMQVADATSPGSSDSRLG